MKRKEIMPSQKAFNLLLIIFLFVSATLVAQNNESGISQTIKLSSLKHPYLLFDTDSKNDLLKKIKSDQKLSEILQKQLIMADRYLKMPVKTDLFIPLERSRIYDKGEFFSTMANYMEASFNLAFAYQVTGNNKYADKAFVYAEMICKLDSWVYTFHKFNNIYSRVWPWNVKDDQVVFSFDLQSARTATHMSLIYDWLYPALNKGQRDRIRGALLENAITRVRGNYEYHWWASAYRCNWCGICHSGLGITALALLKEDPHLVDVVESSYTGVKNMLSEIGEDGGWQEGRGYWAYGLGHSSWFMDAVNRLSDGKYNLFLHEKIKNNPVDFPLYTMGAAFGDGHGKPVGSSWLINKIISETGNQTAAWYRDNYLRNSESVFDLLWYPPDTKPLEPEVKSKHFKGIGWAVMQNNFCNKESFSIICKAGENNDPHHGHMDCGQFVVNYKGKEFIRETKHPAYDDYYFSGERWDYVTASSQGHNLIHVNDESQYCAKLKDQEWKENVGGKITRFSTTDSLDYVSMDLTNAYPGKELKYWQRQIFFYKPTVAIILDNVGSEKGSVITSRIHPGGEIQLEKNCIIINNENDRLLVIPVTNQDYRIHNGRDASLSVKEKNNFEWIPYTELTTIAQSEKTILGWIILPWDKEINPQDILNSVEILHKKDNQLKISCTIKGEMIQYVFTSSGQKYKWMIP